ncbi:hypothetical protein PoB_003217700 [Plakobranchus ocellatus]|uniref:Uncharacterized protein n=1 Tax=Plakobranchus ocellatus TaxID=259542 RepID=A0AAV4AF77_9GAST|nr:hypothetical protein PoB_003217700 [Plakobranchus ocellatus]
MSVSEPNLAKLQRNLANCYLYLGELAQPVHNKVISGFRALPQARAPVVGLEPATEGSLRSQGGLASHCATDAPRNPNESDV